MQETKLSKDQLKSEFAWINLLSTKWLFLSYPPFLIESVTVLKEAFTAFDNEKKGAISLDIIGTILEMLGHAVEEEELDDIIDE